ncbi:unnamed protein product [Effrenium voratum]|nr:unnamed protein product [Effrenium voratum]|mmetsp:Transcript_129411/g.307051  ORF Transcript_129411/g.307051 Transcript_129411/m.307051 type:complete len:211 (-) Transcript_129411:151-783(-)
MDLTIHIKAGGAATTLSLNLDVPAHQMTALAHVQSILQMCGMYADSRPSQMEAQQQLKKHVEKLNLMQSLVLRQQSLKNTSIRTGRNMRPLPAILCSGHLAANEEDHGEGEEFDLSERPLVKPRPSSNTPVCQEEPSTSDSLPCGSSCRSQVAEKIGGTSKEWRIPSAIRRIRVPGVPKIFSRRSSTRVIPDLSDIMPHGLDAPKSAQTT